MHCRVDISVLQQSRWIVWNCRTLSGKVQVTFMKTVGKLGLEVLVVLYLSYELLE